MSRSQLFLAVLPVVLGACSDQGFSEISEPVPAGDGSEFGLEIDPNPIDFGTLAVGCDDTQTIVLRNIGDGDLEIESFDQSDGNFWLSEGPELPFWLPAGTEQALQIGFSPPGTGTFQGRLLVESDQGMAQGEQIGSGGDISSFEDEWEIPDVQATDIMFAIDSSCSILRGL